MNEAIKLAIEKGGYTNWESVDFVMDEIKANGCGFIVLDPLFWQALGKALGWKKGRLYTFTSPARTQSRVNPNITFKVPKHTITRRTKPLSWKTVALRFFELKLTGGDEEAFWKELLTKPL